MSWNGVKQQNIKAEIEAWCDSMYIKNYTIRLDGVIDVDDNVMLRHQDFEELPYKFGIVKGYFSLAYCKNLKSLKNCPDIIDSYFDVDNCTSLDSLEGCPKEVGSRFFCRNCKQKFTDAEIRSLCKVSWGVVNE